MGEGSARPPVSSARRPFHDLGLRAASGVVLAAIALTATISGSWTFAALVLVGAGLMCWEWGRIVRGDGLDAAGVVHAIGVITAAVLAAMGQLLFATVIVLITTVVVLVLSFSRGPLLSWVGVVYVGVPTIALISLRSDPALGLTVVLFVLLVVCAVDIGAFLGGRSIGGPKLWPAVSPNKTWAGFLSGISGGTLVGLAFAYWLNAPALHLAFVALVLGIISQAGDLAESSLKRSFGVKDSSNLIPGHGGVMDRVDGIVAAATLAGIIGHLFNVASPARGLLYGM